MSRSDDLWEKFTSAPKEPRQSCPIIDSAQRDIRGAVRDADRARKEAEAGAAADALEAASSALSELDDPLEECRSINGALRDRCDHFEKVAEEAINGMVEDEESIERATRTCAALMASIQTKWWRRLLDHAAAILWRRRARATAERNANLRWALVAAQEREVHHTTALVHALEFLDGLEWEHIGPHRKRCPECFTEWNTINPLARTPEHDMNCGIDAIITEVEDALHDRPRIYRVGEEGA